MQRHLITAAGVVIAAFLAWGFWSAARARSHQAEILSAQIALQALADFEHAYQKKTGAFAPDIDTLLKASGHEREFLQLLPQAVDMSTLKLTVDANNFAIEAVALDPGRSTVRIRGSR
jgi:hypothetical protein